MQHKQNRRVDYLLTTLLKVARDKALEIFRKVEKSKHTHRILLCEINKQHKTAQNFMGNQLNKKIITTTCYKYITLGSAISTFTFHTLHHQRVVHDNT